MASRAKAVSIASLSKSIDAGVKLAARRHGVKIGGETVIRNWEILGKVLRDQAALANPLEVAQTIATGSKLPGIPVVAKLGKEILVGVIPININVGF